MKMVNLFFYFTLITLKNRGTKNSVIIVSRRNVEFSSTKIINWWNKVKIKKMKIKKIMQIEKITYRRKKKKVIFIFLKNIRVTDFLF